MTHPPFQSDIEAVLPRHHLPIENDLGETAARHVTSAIEPPTRKHENAENHLLIAIADHTSQAAGRIALVLDHHRGETALLEIEIEIPRGVRDETPETPDIDDEISVAGADHLTAARQSIHMENHILIQRLTLRQRKCRRTSEEKGMIPQMQHLEIQRWKE